MSSRPPILDGHNDVLQHICRANDGTTRAFFERNDSGHIDLPRIREGGLSGGFFAIFVPPLPGTWGTMEEVLTETEDGWYVAMPPPIEQSYALEFTLEKMACLFRLVRDSQGQMKIVRSAADLQACLDNDVIAVILHIEGAEVLDYQMDTLYVLYEAGLRSLGPVWSRQNIFGYGVPFRCPASPDIGPGLTDAGKNLVKICNQLGIMIDLSHLNEKGFWDVARLSHAPLVATHSAAHAITPTARNLTDKQLGAIAESDGLVGVNFNVFDLRPDGKRDPDAALDVIVRHIRYIANRIGVEHVALGSDFDGATMPPQLKDVAGFPRLIHALENTGFLPEDMAKICHQNWQRVLAQTW